MSGPTVRAVPGVIKQELVGDHSKDCLQHKHLPLQNLLQGPHQNSLHNFNSNNPILHKPFYSSGSQHKPNNIPITKPMINLNRRLSSNSEQETIQSANQTPSCNSSTNINLHTTAIQRISVLPCVSAGHAWRQNSCSGPLQLVKNGGTAATRGSCDMSLLLSPLAGGDGSLSGRSCRGVHWYGGGGSLDYLDDLSAQQHMNTYVFYT